ncbi:MAG: hypothetical protein JSR82_16435 [Verrucomicrobia bacterium]|nr:hypothetical protein [Verrucomicrobiota bacterium]
MRRVHLLLLAFVVLLAALVIGIVWVAHHERALRSYSDRPLIPSALSTSRDAPFSSQNPNPPFTSSGGSSSSPAAAARPNSSPSPLPRAAAGQPATTARAPLPGPPASPLSRELADPALPPAAAPQVVLKMFDTYRSRFGGYPSGSENRDFVNALAGNNPRGLPILDRDSPRVSPRGELLDPWGTPYFFHLIDRNYLEIRSAGPDRQMYTADDVVAAPPRAEAAPEVRR